MDEILERAQAQLSAIEMDYSIRIKNKEDIARIIASGLKEKSEVYAVCTGINSWIACHDPSREVAVPEDLVSQFIFSVR